MQKHAMKNKCKSCQLCYYSKHMLQEHKNKDHINCSKAANFKKYKIPSDREGKPITFRPPSKTNVTFQKGVESQGDSIYLKPSLAFSTTLSVTPKLKINVSDHSMCVECEEKMKTTGHFVKYQKCTKCPYATSCMHMVVRHSAVFHPNGTKKCKALPYVIGPPIKLSSPMFCICGFSSQSGNHLAKHLAICEGGRKSAYPSYANAMGITGNPSLDEYIKAARAMTRDSDAPSPPLHDLTPFMTMNMETNENMEVDEDQGS